MKDLSTVERSITYIIATNHQLLDSCESVAELKTALQKLFNDNHVNTEASNRLLFNISRHKNVSYALQTVYNSFLCGANLVVGRK